MCASLTSAVAFVALPNVACSYNTSLIVVCFVSPVVAPFLTVRPDRAMKANVPGGLGD
jgi:hypothetical protein